MSQVRRAWRLALLGALGMWAAGCMWQSGGQETAVAPSLAEVTVPQGFTFATSGPVAVQVQVADALLAPGQQGALVLTNPEGRVLYRGAVQGGIPGSLELALPLEHTQLMARLDVGGVRHEATVPVSSGAAALRFE